MVAGGVRPGPLTWMGTRKNFAETQKSDQIPTPGPKIEDRECKLREPKIAVRAPYRLKGRRVKWSLAITDVGTG